MEVAINTRTMKARVRGFFGHFPQVTVIFNRLTSLMEFECDVEEPECFAIIGDTGTGKSTLLKHFVSKNPRIEHEEFTEVPVLYAEVPAKCSVKMLAGLLLRALGSPFWNRGDELDRTTQLLVLIASCKVRLIVLDEVNHLADRGAEKSHYYIGDWIKQLMAQAKVPIVLAGTPSAAILWETNEQLADRFKEVITLRPLSMAKGRAQECVAVLRAFARLMEGFLLVDIAEPALAETVGIATGGRLRAIRQLFVRAIEIADENQLRGINRSTLIKSFLTVIYPNARSDRNPFSSKFNGVPLTKSDEPFAPRRRVK